MMFSTKKILTTLFFLLILVSFTSQIAVAVAPSDDVIAKWKKDGVYEEKMEFLNDFHKRGGCSPVENLLFKKKSSLATGTQIVDTVRVLVLMVDFSDHPAEGGAIHGTPADFDSILFSQGYLNPTGSMTDYYLENSYGNFYIEGEISGWYRMPQTYAYYTDGKSGLGTYPQNCQKLVEDAVLMADTGVDFSRYDFNNDGKCDGVILIHSGPGAELTGDSTDIWSHKWNLFNNTAYTLDGVEVNNYNMNPEEYITYSGTELSPIGVFCHEYGHFLGLPDLYDTGNTPYPTSDGLGRWSIMASGNYNGDSKLPAHFDPWCKKEIGFLNLIDVTDNLYNVEIPQIETSPTAYKLRNSATEYFIVENRQKVGFDAALPYSGLLIYHIDETRPNNNDYLHYKVGLEQADGLDQLAFVEFNDGDIGDPFPGSTNNREFHMFSTPSSDLFSSFESFVSVWNISNSDSIMTADLDVAYSRPWVEGIGVLPFVLADADADGIMEVGETIKFYFNIRNLMRAGENVYATLSSSNSGLEYTINNITVPGAFNTASFSNPSTPIEFVIPDTLTPHIDSFFLTITTDSLDGNLLPVNGSPTYTTILGFEATLGKPNIVIVDADRGASLELKLDSALLEKKVPADIWDKNSLGTPSLNDLTAYDIILWHTGEDIASGAINAADINVMKQLMDNGKNLMLSTVRGIDDIMAIDSTLLVDYFHARKDTTNSWPEFRGVVGNPVGEGLKIRHLNEYTAIIATLLPTGSGSPAFTVGLNSVDICGITYDGSYKSVLLTFGADLIMDYQANLSTTDDLIANIIDFFGGVATSVYDGNPFVTIPNSFELTQNYPNPFNPTTTIQYTLRPTNERGAVTRLDIFNLIGQRVVTLVNKAQIPGNYEVQWDGTNSANNEVASGIYFYRLTRGSESNTKKMTLLK